jgi:hypothetical protein
MLGGGRVSGHLLVGSWRLGEVVCLGGLFGVEDTLFWIPCTSKL